MGGSDQVARIFEKHFTRSSRVINLTGKSENLSSCVRVFREILRFPRNERKYSQFTYISGGKHPSRTSITSQITFAILPPPQVISSCLRRGGSVKVLTFPGKDLTHLKMATLKPFLFMQKHTIHKIQTLIL